jgi:hypothetical protein
MYILVEHYLRYRLFGHRADIYSYIRLKGSFSGHSHSEETKQKISQAGKGSKNHFYGKRHGEIAKQKMSLKKCHKVKCVETGILYGSTLECAEKTGYSQSYISRSARGVYQKSQRGRFQYV